MRKLYIPVILFLVGILNACNQSSDLNKSSSNKWVASSTNDAKIHATKRAACSGTPGEVTLCHIQEDYASSLRSCNTSDDSPAFLCSGLVLRGTNDDLNRTYLSWNPSPASVTSGGVSFSYLRSDAKYNKLAYDYVTGFIFNPVLYTPEGQDDNISILCAFTIDGGTDARDNHGCGMINGYPKGKDCPSQSIFTGTDWVNKNYNESDGNRWNYCGFIVSNHEHDFSSQEQFNAMIDAMNILGAPSFNEQNELRLATWAQDKQDIPIEAFFYVTGSTDGLKSSQKDQRDFYDFSNSKRIIPIIEITFPHNKNDEVKFSYNTADQVVH